MENLGIKIQHQHQETHNTWGGDIGRAALGGAITGIMAGAGVNGGEYLTNIAGNTLQSTLGTTLTNAVNKGISSAVISYTSTIGNTMSMATINGGSLRDILKSGRDTATSKDTLKNIAASGLSAGITAGLTDKLNLANPNTFTDKLKESAISNITSTAIQSTINGDSFTESLKHQAINTIVMAGANYTANKIGGAYHTGEINKATQLTLHAGLGAITNALTGNDALSGAIAGVSGELVTGWIFDSLNEKYANEDGIISKDQFEINRNTAIEYGGLAGGITSLITGKVQNLDISDIRDNVYSGYRVGKNAGENNLTMYLEGTDLTGSRKEKESREHSLEMAGLASDTFGNDPYKKVGTIFWEGENTKEGRTDAAYELFEYVSNYEFAPGEPLNIVGHSHGGNVIKEFTNIYVLPQEITNFNNLASVNIGNMTYMPKLVNYKTVDNALLNGTPHRTDYRFNMTVMTPGQTPIAVSDRKDIITQDIMGGIDYKNNSTINILNKLVIGIPTTFNNPSKIMDNAINIEIEQKDTGIIKSHIGLNTPETWKNYIDQAIKNNNSSK